MARENFVLIQNASSESPDLTKFSYTDKTKGSGYHRISGSLHTVLFSLDSFKGYLQIQGTLQLYPADNEWSTLVDIPAQDSSILSSNFVRNFIGNWVWVRLAYIIEEGEILQVRLSY